MSDYADATLGSMVTGQSFHTSNPRFNKRKQMNNEDILGVALTKCFYCQKDSDIIINTVLHKYKADQVKNFHGKVISTDPCSKCAEYMKLGIIIITIDADKSDKGWNSPPEEWKALSDHEKSRRILWMPNPYRAGGWFVIKESALADMVEDKETLRWALEHRFMFMDDGAATALGLYEAAKDAPNELPV